MAWQACPWEHMSSSSAPCVVPTGPSMIGQQLVLHPSAKHGALLGMFYVLRPFLERFSRYPIRGIKKLLRTFSTELRIHLEVRTYHALLHTKFSTTDSRACVRWPQVSEYLSREVRYRTGTCTLDLQCSCSYTY